MQNPVTMEALAFASLLPRSPVPAGIAVVFLALVLWGYDALRYTLTESCITQVRQAYGALLDAAPSEARPPLHSATPTRALDAGKAPFIMQDAKVQARVT